MPGGSQFHDELKSLIGAAVREAALYNSIKGADRDGAVRVVGDGVAEVRLQFPLHPVAIDRLRLLCESRGLPMNLSTDRAEIGLPPILRVLAGNALRPRWHFSAFALRGLPKLATRGTANLRRSELLAAGWNEMPLPEGETRIRAGERDFQTRTSREGVFDVTVVTGPAPERLEEAHGYLVAIPARAPDVVLIGSFETYEDPMGDVRHRLRLARRKFGDASAAAEWLPRILFDMPAEVRPDRLMDAVRDKLKPVLEEIRPAVLELATRLDAEEAVVGRDREALQLVRLFALPSPKPVVLVGRPGTGRTSVVRAMLARLKTAGHRKPALALSLADATELGSLDEVVNCLRLSMREADRMGAVLVLSDVGPLLEESRANGANGINLLRAKAGRSELPLCVEMTESQFDRLKVLCPEWPRAFEVLPVEPLGTDDVLAVLRQRAAARFTVAGARPSDPVLASLCHLSERHDTGLAAPGRALRLMELVRADMQSRIFFDGPDALRDLEVTDVERVAEATYGVKRSKLAQLTPETVDQVMGHLETRVLGQGDALRAVRAALRRSALGLREGNRPVGSFLFVGWPGSGKTEVARALAESLFGSTDAMIRIDMSEYQEHHALSRLIGSPPGYVGNQDGGQLTKPMLADPNRVILLDEVEKADPRIFDVLLQILEDGRLTDGRGQTADFRRAVIIMTSNLGTRDLADALQRPAMGFLPAATDTDAERQAIDAAVRRWFRPEALGRMDAVVHFRRLDRDLLAEIVVRDVARANEQLGAHGISFDLAPDAVDLVLAAADPVAGARGVKRALRTLVIDPLVDTVHTGSRWTVGVDNGRIVPVESAAR